MLPQFKGTKGTLEALIEKDWWDARGQRGGRTNKGHERGPDGDTGMEDADPTAEKITRCVSVSTTATHFSGCRCAHRSRTTTAASASKRFDRWRGCHQLDVERRLHKESEIVHSIKTYPTSADWVECLKWDGILQKKKKKREPQTTYQLYKL